MPIPSTMRAVVLAGRGADAVAVRRVPVPTPGPRELLVRVDAAGICTSLVKLIDQAGDHSLMHGWDTVAHPVILGDEGSVTVVAAGVEVASDWPLGLRGVIQPAVDWPPIRHRERYRNSGHGVAKIACGHTLPGHLAEYMLVTEEVLAARCLVPVPDGAIPFSHAALSEPVSCCVSGQGHHVHLMQADPTAPRTAMTGVRPGGVTVVVGLGAMGRMHVDVALAARPRAIIGLDPMAERRERLIALLGDKARASGVALETCAPEAAPALVDALCSGGGADDIIVAVGIGAVIESAQLLAGRGGVINLFGGLRHGVHVIGLDANRVHYRETIVTGSSGGSPWDIAETLRLMAAGDLEASAHITRIGDLDHALGFIDDVRHQRLDGKAIVYPHHRLEAVRVVERWSAEDEAVLLAGAA